MNLSEYKFMPEKPNTPELDKLFDRLLSYADFNPDEVYKLIYDHLPKMEQEPFSWMVMNGVVTQRYFLNKEKAELFANEMQKSHDLSGSLASFSVKPLYSQPQPPSTEQEASRTQGMTLKQRIEHVGGTFTKDDLVVFGSIMAVNALVGHIIRDIPPQPDNNVNAELLGALKDMVEMVEMNGFGKAYVMDVAKLAIEKADGMGVE